MSYIQITKENIDTEHICCALGAKQYERAVNEKKNWLSERMDEGLVFYRLDERAKVFIEYLPAEMAWLPIKARNYMYINCLWVSGRHKNNDHARQLLNYCKQDAIQRGMDGLVHIVGTKKYPYLSDKRFFEHMDFKQVDQAEPYFQLMALKWNADAPLPFFNKKNKIIHSDKGISIFYTVQCPFAVGVLEELRAIALDRQMPFCAHRITSRKEAQNASVIWMVKTPFCRH